MRTLFWSGLLAALVLGTVACGQSPEPESTDAAEPPASAPAEPTELDAEAVAARLAAGEEIVLLDVRTPEELVEDGAIEGYLHIPIDELETRLAEVPTDKPIVAY